MTTSTIYIICGAQGAGKSTIASKISKAVGNAEICENDQFFMRNGKYMWNRNAMHHAINYCKSKCVHAMQQGKNVIVANTFTKSARRKFYIDLAQKMDYNLVLVHSIMKFQNVHAVPSDAVENVRKMWEDFTAAEIAAADQNSVYEISSSSDVDAMIADISR